MIELHAKSKAKTSFKRFEMTAKEAIEQVLQGQPGLGGAALLRKVNALGVDWIYTDLTSYAEAVDWLCFDKPTMTWYIRKEGDA